MVPRWLRNTACIAVASATLFMQAAVNAAADVDGNSSGGGADTGEVSGATAEGGIVAKVIGGHEAGGGVAARDNATTLGSGREPGDPPADPARVSDPPSNDATTTSDTTSTSDDTTSNSTENSTATETSNSTETTQTSNEEPEVKLPPSVDPSTEETASPTPALFSDLPTPSATPSVNNTESSTTTGSDYAEVAQTAVTVPAVPTEVAAAPSATVVASAVPDPPAAEPAPVPVAALLTPPAPEVAPAAVVVPATDPITVLQVVLTSAVTTLILAPIAQVSAWFGDGWPPPTGPGSPSPARKWSEPGVTTRAADLSSMLNESQQVQPRSMHAAPLSSNIGGAAMGQVLIPVDEPVPALVAAEAPDVPSDGVGAFLRDAFNEIVHSPPLMVLVIAALPGLAGLIFLTSVGMRLGYCQAKAGLVLRASGLARFAPTGPLGVVRSGSFIVLHQRKAAPRHRVFKDVAGFKGHKDVTSLKHLKDSA